MHFMHHPNAHEQERAKDGAGWVGADRDVCATLGKYALAGPENGRAHDANNGAHDMQRTCAT